MKVQRLERQNTMFFKIVDNLQTVNPLLMNPEKHIEEITEALQKNVDEKALIQNVAKSIIALEDMKGQKMNFLSKQKSSRNKNENRRTTMLARRYGKKDTFNRESDFSV